MIEHLDSTNSTKVNYAVYCAAVSKDEAAELRNTLRRVLQPLQRFENLRLPRLGGLALFLFFLDDFFRRVGDEFLVGELGVDALDVGLGLGQFLVEPRLLRRKDRSRP